jgi:hypothetical protein
MQLLFTVKVIPLHDLIKNHPDVQRKQKTEYLPVYSDTDEIFDSHQDRFLSLFVILVSIAGIILVAVKMWEIFG